TSTSTVTPTATNTPLLTSTPTNTATVTLTSTPTATLANPLVVGNILGFNESFSTTGAIDQGNPFFQSLGTNGRTCATCHTQSSGWSISSQEIQSIFTATLGLD